MPASFKVLHYPVCETDTMIADFSESAIGRVALVDSGFWWIILLRAYTKSTGHHTLADMVDYQRGMGLILTLCLADGFDTFPTLLCADGCCMVDCWMLCNLLRVLSRPKGKVKSFWKGLTSDFTPSAFTCASTFGWTINSLIIFTDSKEEHSHTAVNKFNVLPDSILDWIFDFLPLKGGFFTGNVSAAATSEQASVVMDSLEARWDGQSL